METKNIFPKDLVAKCDLNIPGYYDQFDDVEMKLDLATMTRLKLKLSYG